MADQTCNMAQHALLQRNVTAALPSCYSAQTLPRQCAPVPLQCKCLRAFTLLSWCLKFTHKRESETERERDRKKKEKKTIGRDRGMRGLNNVVLLRIYPTSLSLVWTWRASFLTRLSREKGRLALTNLKEHFSIVS